MPLYYLASDVDTKAGGLYRISTVAEGATTDSELLVEGFNNPLGLTQDHAGNIYVTEVLAEPEGSVKKIIYGSGEFSDFVIGLDYPSGLAVDSFEQLYISENGKDRVIKINGSEKASALSDSVSSPELAMIGDEDAVYLVEAGDQVISKISTNGEREVVSPVLVGLRSVAVSPSGVVYALLTDEASAIGEIVRVLNDSETELVGDELINHAAIACDAFGFIYVSEAAPANVISRISLETGAYQVISEAAENPGAITLTPF